MTEPAIFVSSEEFPDTKLKTREMHGLGAHPIHETWKRMIARCYAKSATHFHLYGGRGIRVCKRWHWFVHFYEDMLPDWHEGLSLDRIDNNGHYHKENCRWATFRMQIHNRRRNLDVPFDGEIRKLSEISELYAVVGYATVYSRVKRGWNIRAALLTPELRVCKRRPFVLDGIQYKSLRGCAKQLNTSTTTICSMLKSGRGHYL